MSNSRFIRHVQEVRKEQSCSECCPSGEKPPVDKKFAELLKITFGATDQVAKPPEEDIHVMAYVKGQDQYVWLFTANQERDVRRSFGRMASNPGLSLDWLDAARLS